MGSGHGRTRVCLGGNWEVGFGNYKSKSPCPSVWNVIMKWSTPFLPSIAQIWSRAWPIYNLYQIRHGKFPTDHGKSEELFAQMTRTHTLAFW